MTIGGHVWTEAEVPFCEVNMVSKRLGFVCPTIPGLVLCNQRLTFEERWRSRGGNCWSVTHALSGRNVFGNACGMTRCAERAALLGALPIDWTQSEERVLAGIPNDGELRQALNALSAEWTGMADKPALVEVSLPTGRVTGDQLRELVASLTPGLPVVVDRIDATLDDAALPADEVRAYVKTVPFNAFVYLSTVRRTVEELGREHPRGVKPPDEWRYQAHVWFQTRHGARVTASLTVCALGTVQALDGGAV